MQFASINSLLHSSRPAVDSFISIISFKTYRVEGRVYFFRCHTEWRINHLVWTPVVIMGKTDATGRPIWLIGRCANMCQIIWSMARYQPPWSRSYSLDNHHAAAEIVHCVSARRRKPFPDRIAWFRRRPIEILLLHEAFVLSKRHAHRVKTFIMFRSTEWMTVQSTPSTSS